MTFEPGAGERYGVVLLTLVIAVAAITGTSGWSLLRVVEVLIIVAAVIFLAADFVARHRRKKRRVDTENELRKYRRALYRVAHRGGFPYTETQRDLVTVGAVAALDQMVEEYETVPTTASGLLFRYIGLKSQPATEAAGGRLSNAMQPTVQILGNPAGGPLIASTYQMEDPDDDRQVSALVLFSRILAQGEVLRWSATYHLPSTWDPLRNAGHDRYVIHVAPSSAKTRYEIVISFPSGARNVGWSLDGPAGAVAPQPVTFQDGAPRLKWEADNPTPGDYTFEIEMDPLATNR